MKSMIVCENRFCIYWDRNSCILDSISLNVMGNCNHCIYADINETYLKEKRKVLLRKYHKS